jgi:hypothetical protein
MPSLLELIGVVLFIGFWVGMLMHLDPPYRKKEDKDK